MLFLNTFIFLVLIILTLNEEITVPINIRDEGNIVVSEHTRRILQNLKKDDTSNYVHTTIFGDSEVYNYYYINVYLGINKQKSSLILDTGSSVMCTTCSTTCNSCGNHENPHFDSKESSSFSILNCKDNNCQVFPNHSTCSATPDFSEPKCKFSIVCLIIIFLVIWRRIIL
jgi:hypothetical protein